MAQRISNRQSLPGVVGQESLQTSIKSPLSDSVPRAEETPSDTLMFGGNKVVSGVETGVAAGCGTVWPVGLEPTTFALEERNSIQLSYGQKTKRAHVSSKFIGSKPTFESVKEIRREVLLDQSKLLGALYGDSDRGCYAFNIGQRAYVPGQWIYAFEIGDIPGDEGTYAFSVGRRVVYVGQSSDLRSRIGSHGAASNHDYTWKWRRSPEPVSLRFRMDRFQFEGIRLERKLIARLCPPINVLGKSERPTAKGVQS